jgi:hypothetical protein
MPKNSLQQSNSGQWTIPVEALILRIRRVLSENTPYRDLKCDKSDNGYYVRIVSQDAQHNTRQGPYYFHDLLGLARMLNIFKPQHTYPVQMTDKRTGRTYTEGTLPPKLRFEVVTPVLLDALRTIQAHYPDGYYIAPSGKAQIVTAPVKTKLEQLLDENDLIPEPDPKTMTVAEKIAYMNAHGYDVQQGAIVYPADPPYDDPFSNHMDDCVIREGKECNCPAREGQN